MFKQYKNLVDSSLDKEKNTIKKYESQKNTLALEIKQTLLNEVENMNSKTLLKDYSPIQHSNTMTELNQKFSDLLSKEKNDLEKIKIKLNEDLIGIMEDTGHPKNYPTELYKVINSARESPYDLCRVYFTLVPLKQWDCKPGDPIAVEWVSLNGVNRFTDKKDSVNCRAERTAQGWTGLKMPNFCHNGSLTNNNRLFDFNHWGTKGNQQKWWMDWVKENRPM